MSSVLRKSAAFTAHAKPTVGDTKTSFVTDDHLGWLRCDGRSVTKAEFGILFGVIGYTFGGSGNNFNLPDAQGRVVGHVGSSLIPDASFNYVIGDLSGQDQVTLTIPQLPAHNHTGLTGVAGSHTHTGTTSTDLPGAGSENVASGGGATVNGNENTGHFHTLNIAANGDHQHTIASQGNGVPVSVMQATIFMGNLFIYSGIPPYGVWPYTTGTNIY
jgi:microcystin-dependent protein